MEWKTPKSLKSSYVQHKPLEIYVFIDPFCSDCWAISTIIKKLQIQYGEYFTLKHVISGQLDVLNDKKQHPRSSRMNLILGADQNTDSRTHADQQVFVPHLAAISIKAAELQGKRAGFRFLYRLQELLFLENANVTDINVLQRCAKNAGLDINEFTRDVYSTSAARAFQCDLKISSEMEVMEMPALVFFNENIEDEGIKVTGLYSYNIYVQILTEMLEDCIQPHPAALPPLEMFLKENPIVTTQDLTIIYDLPEKQIERKLKKLQLQRKVKKVDMAKGSFWRYTANA